MRHVHASSPLRYSGDGVKSLGDDGEVHGTIVEQREGVEDVEGSEDIESLEGGEDDDVEVDGEGGGVADGGSGRDRESCGKEREEGCENECAHDGDDVEWWCFSRSRMRREQIQCKIGPT